MFDGLSFRHPELIHLVWIALAAVGLLAWLERRGRDALGRFVSAVMQRRLADRSTPGRRAARLSMILATFVFGIVALMRPQTQGASETVAGSRVAADIMVVLDVSRSMLADDAPPTRLARAKAEIGEMVDALRGHRVGLVAFAGRAAVLCPLTSDHGFFRMILRGVDTSSVSRGGTRIGDGLRAALEAFPSGPGARLIVLITDGEDQGSYPLDAAKAALEAGVRIIAIGIGSEEGSQITLVDPESGARSLLMHEGAPVFTRLDGALLREIALTTEGAYVPAGVAALDLESIVRAHIEPIVRDSAVTSVRVVPGERYPWFVLGALVSLIAAVWLGAGTGRRSTR